MKIGIKLTFLALVLLGGGCRERHPRYLDEFVVDGGPDAMECESNAACMDAGASFCEVDSGVCQECFINADCSHIAGKGVCDDGACVQCTGLEDGACGSKVCDAALRQCTDKAQDSVPVCGECVSSAECEAGLICVQLSYGGSKLQGYEPGLPDDGKRCVWDKAEVMNGDCGQVAPFIKTLDDLSTVDGETSKSACVLSFTSCTAYSQFRTQDCETGGAADHSKCGISGAEDAYCAPFNSSFRCTVPCGNVSDDCSALSNTCMSFAQSSTGKACDFGL